MSHKWFEGAEANLYNPDGVRSQMKNNTKLISEVLEKIPNKYMAVTVAAKRARKINEKLAASTRTSAKKPTTMALEEISDGLVVAGP